MTVSVFLSASVNVRTADLFALREEGNAFGLDSETTVFAAASKSLLAKVHRQNKRRKDSDRVNENVENVIPRFFVPQMSQLRTALASPVDSFKRLPQSVQKINDPIADIFAENETLPGKEP